MDLYDFLLKRSSMFVEAVSLQEAKDFIRTPVSSPKMTEADKSKIKTIIDVICNSADFTNPRFDVFVEGLLRLRSLYQRFDPTNFDPRFIASFFNNDDEDMWSWIEDSKRKVEIYKQQNRSYQPSEDDVKGMRYIVYDLNSILNQDELFSTSENWGNLVSLEGESLND